MPYRLARQTPCFVFAALAFDVAASSARADDAACKPLADAIAKQAVTPYHETATANGRPLEKIYLADAVYVANHGKWMKMPQDHFDAGRKSMPAFFACKSVRTEAVDGQPATVYAARFQSPSGNGDAQVWIGAAGLPLKEVMDEQTESGKAQISARFAYDNVRAPAATN